MGAECGRALGADQVNARPVRLLALGLAAALASCAGSPERLLRALRGVPLEERTVPLRDYLNPRPIPVSLHFRGDFDPSLGADGKTLLFVSERTGNWDIFWKDLTSKDAAVQVTNHSAADYAPAISPDGNRVAFITRREDAQGDLALVDLGGRERKFLLPAGQKKTGEEEPVWLDDRRVLLTRTSGGAKFLSVFNTETSTFTDWRELDGTFPDISPDRRWLVFTRLTGERKQIWRGRLPENGGPPEDLRRLTILPFEETSAVFAGTDRVLVIAQADDTNGDGTIDVDDRSTVWSVPFDPETGAAGEGYQALTSSAYTSVLPAASESAAILTTDLSGQLNLWSLNLEPVKPDTTRDPVAVARGFDSMDDRLLAYRRISPDVFGMEARRAALYFRGEEFLAAGLWGSAQTALERLKRDPVRDYWARRGEILGLALDSQILAATGLPLSEPEVAEGYGANRSALVRISKDSAIEPDLRARALLELGRLQEAFGLTLDAIGSYRAVEEGFPAVREIAGAAALERARIYTERGDRNAAVSLLAGIIRQYSDIGEVALPAAERAISVSSNLYLADEDRIAALRRLERDAPGFLRAAIGIEVAGIYTRSGNLAAARQELLAEPDRFQETEPLRERWARAILAVSLRDRQPEPVFAQWERLSSLKGRMRSELIDVLLLLASSSAGEEKGAILDRALALDPDCPETRFAVWEAGIVPALPPDSPSVKAYIQALDIWKSGRNAGAAEKAIEKIEEALERDYGRPELHQFRGFLYHRLERFLIEDGASYTKRQNRAYLEAAVDSYQTALVYARQAGQPRRVALLNLALAQAFIDFPSPNYRLADEFITGYLNEGPPDDPLLAFHVGDRRMRTLFHAESYEEAADTAGENIRRARQIGNRRLELSGVVYLGLIRQSMKQYAKAETQFTRALELSGETGFREPEYLFHRNRAISRYHLGKYPEAMEDLDEAEKLVVRNRSGIDRRAGLSPALITVKGDDPTEAPWGFDSDQELRLIGLYRSFVQEGLGEVVPAAENFERALKGAPAPSGPVEMRERAVTLNRLGILRQRIGDTGDAEIRLSESLALTRKIGDRSGTAVVLSGRLQMLAARPTATDCKGLLKLAREAIAAPGQAEPGSAASLAFAQLLERTAIAQMRCGLDESAAERLQPVRHFEYARRLLSAHEEETGRSNIVRQLSLLLNEARAFRYAGLPEGIPGVLDQFRELARFYRIPDRELWASAVECETGVDAAACPKAAAGIDSLGLWSPSFLGDEERIASFGELLRRDAARQASALSSAEMLLTAEERLRRLTVNAAVFRNPAIPVRYPDGELFARFSRASRQWREAVASLMTVTEKAAGSSDAQEFRQLQRKADDLEKEFRAVFDAITQKSPELSALVSLRPASVSDIQYDLPDAETVYIPLGEGQNVVRMTARELTMLPAGGLPADITGSQWISDRVPPPGPVLSRYVSLAHYLTSWSRRNVNRRRAIVVSDEGIRDEGDPREKPLQAVLETFAGAIPGVRGFFYEGNGPAEFQRDLSNLESQYHFVHILSPLEPSPEGPKLSLPGGRLPVTGFMALAGEPNLWVLARNRLEQPADLLVAAELAAYGGAPGLLVSDGRAAEAAKVRGEAELWKGFYSRAIRLDAPRTAALWQETVKEHPDLGRYVYYGYPGIAAGEVKPFVTGALNALANETASAAARKDWPAAVRAAERAVTCMDVIGVPPPQLAQMLNAAVYSLKQMEEWGRAAAYEDRLSKLYAEAGASTQAAQALYFAGQDLLRAGRPDDAFGRFEDALRLAEGNPQVTLVVESERARGLALAGRYEEAVGVYTEAIRQAEVRGDRSSQSELLYNRGRIRYENLNDPGGAAQDLEAAQTLARSLRDTAIRARQDTGPLEAAIRRNRLTLALATQARGRLLEALEEFRAIRLDAGSRKDRELELQSSLYEASVLWGFGRSDAALAVLLAGGAPADIPELKDAPHGTAADYLNLLALVHWSMGSEKLSLESSKAALAEARRDPDPVRLSAVLSTYGTSLRVLGLDEPAKLYLSEAEKLDRRTGNAAGLRYALRQQALIAARTGHREDAAKLLDEAIGLGEPGTAAGSKEDSVMLELRWLRAELAGATDDEMGRLWREARAAGNPALVARIGSLRQEPAEGSGSAPAAELAGYWLREGPSSPATEGRSGLTAGKAAAFRAAALETADAAAALSLWERGRLKVLRDLTADNGLARSALETIRISGGRTGAAQHDQLAEARAAGSPAPAPVMTGPWKYLLADAEFPLPQPEAGEAVLVAMDGSSQGGCRWWWLAPGELLDARVPCEPGTLGEAVRNLSESLAVQGRFEAALEQFRSGWIPEAIRKRLDGLPAGSRLLLELDGEFARLPSAVFAGLGRPPGEGPVTGQIGTLWELMVRPSRESPPGFRVAGAGAPRLRAGYGLTLASDGRAEFYGQERQGLMELENASGWVHCAGELKLSAVSVSGLYCAGEPLGLVPGTGVSASATEAFPAALEVLALRLKGLSQGIRSPWILPRWRRGASSAQFVRRTYEKMASGEASETALRRTAGEVGREYGHPSSWAGFELFGAIATDNP